MSPEQREAVLAAMSAASEAQQAWLVCKLCSWCNVGMGCVPRKRRDIEQKEKEPCKVLWSCHKLLECMYCSRWHWNLLMIQSPQSCCDGTSAIFYRSRWSMMGSGCLWDALWVMAATDVNWWLDFADTSWILFWINIALASLRQTCAARVKSFLRPAVRWRQQSQFYEAMKAHEMEKLQKSGVLVHCSLECRGAIPLLMPCL